MIDQRIDQASAIAALRSAAPYIRLYRGKSFVIETEVDAVGNGAITRQLLEQIAILHYLSIRVVLVHGGGAGVLDACRELGIQVAVPPAGTLGMDLLRRELEAGEMPVLSPQLQYDLGGERPVDADAFAATIAGRLAAEKLIFCTAAPGILERPDDPRTLISYTDLAGLRRLERSGALQERAMPSAAAIRAALEGDVRRVHVISRDAPDSLLIEVFTNEGGGTLIVADVKALTAAEANPLAVAS